MYFHYLDCYLVCTGCTWTLCHLKYYYLIDLVKIVYSILNCMSVEIDLLSVKLFIPDGVD